jgi:hypothetical protein
LGFEREKIVLNRATVRLRFREKALVMNLLWNENKLEEELWRIACGAEEVEIFDFWLDLESVRHLLAMCSTVSAEVQKLDLRSCGLDAKAAEVIASSLRSNRVLTWLNLSSDKDIGSRGAQALAEMLCVNTFLTVLKIVLCEVGDEGVTHLAVALRRNRMLKELWLGNNGIERVGAAAIAAALPFNQTLKLLSLYNNPLGNDGVEALAKAVPFSALVQLELISVNFGERGCAALVEMLKNGVQLRTLWANVGHWPALEEGFRCNGWLLDEAPKQYLERNKAMHLQARKSVYTLLLIRKLRRTTLSSFPKEILRVVVAEIYSSRGEVQVLERNEAPKPQRTGCLCL